MDWRHYGPLKDTGQALSETPIVIVVLVCLSLVIVQIALFMLTSTTVAQAASEAARVAATMGEEDDALLAAFVMSRLSVLDAVPALMVPGSMTVVHTGTPRSALVRVTVGVAQRPLPIVGWLVAGGRPVRRVTVAGEAPGGESWALPSAPSGEVVYGAEQKP